MVHCFRKKFDRVWNYLRKSCAFWTTCFSVFKLLFCVFNAHLLLYTSGKNIFTSHNFFHGLVTRWLYLFCASKPLRWSLRKNTKKTEPLHLLNMQLTNPTRDETEDWNPEGRRESWGRYDRLSNTLIDESLSRQCYLSIEVSRSQFHNRPAEGGMSDYKDAIRLSCHDSFRRMSSRRWDA